MVFTRENAVRIEKHGMSMAVYSGRTEFPQAAVAYQETEKGHAEEFFHEKSAFIYYIIEGSGVWVIEDREYPAQAGDVVMVPPGKRFYFRGRLRQVCVTVPAWEEEYERHVRFVEL